MVLAAAAAALLVVGALFCAAVLAVGLGLSAPAQSFVGPPPPALPGAETVRIPSPSGSTLAGWWVPAAEPGGGAVVLLHGVWSTRSAMAERARVLHDEGFAVLLFDFQAEGESSGERITFGRLEALDAGAAIAFVRHRLPGERVGAIGVSLGAAAAVLGPTPLPVDALVLESVFSSMQAALANCLRAGLGPVLNAVLAPGLGLLVPPVIGIAPQDLRPIARIDTVTAPLLVASGTVDRCTTIANARALFDRAPQPKRFWAVPDAGHVDLERHDPAAYWRVVLPFLCRYLSQHPDR